MRRISAKPVVRTRILPDQADIPHPRLGFFGVIDERFDSDLLDQVAANVLTGISS